MYSTDDLFSPLDGDVSLQTRFAIGSGNAEDSFESMPLSPLSPFSIEANGQYKSLRRYSVPRKPLPGYKQIHTHSDSISTMQTDQSSEMEKPEQPTPVKRGWRFYGTFATLAIANLICAIDATILSVALPVRKSPILFDIILTTVQDYCYRPQIDSHSSLLGWDFILTVGLTSHDSLINTHVHRCSTVFQPSWASFSHIIGRKSVILTALLLFTVGTVICSIAKNITLLLVGRCVQGVGGGGLVALTYVVITDMVTLRERGKWMSIISLQWAIGSVIGPVIGGAFAEKASWRWIFWLNIPFCVIAAVGIPVCLRLQQKEGSILTKLRAFDWFGSFLFVSATTSCLIPITWSVHLRPSHITY